MKPSKRNINNARAAKYAALNKPPLISKYAAKRRGLVEPSAQMKGEDDGPSS